MSRSELIRTIITWIIGTGGVMLAVIAAMLKVWTDRMQAKANAAAQKELETAKGAINVDLEQLRAVLAERRELLSGVMSAVSTGYSASQDRRLDAFETLWKEVLRIEGVVSPFLFLYDLLDPDEIKNKPYDQLERLIPKVTQEDLHDRLFEHRKEIEQKRPFLGEKLWLLYTAYFTFVGRLSYCVILGREKRRLPAWNENADGKSNHLETLLVKTTALTEEELKYLVGAHPFSIPSRILSALKDKMLGEMNEWLFGKRLVNLSLEQRQQIERFDMEWLLPSKDIPHP